MKYRLPSMTLTETILGILFLFAQAFVIPIALGAMMLIFRIILSDAEMNIFCFTVNFVCALVIFRSFWLRSIRELKKKWLSVLINALKYFLLYYGATVLINLLVYYIDPGFSNANDSNIAAIAAESKLLMSFCLVALVPPVEEILYRGIVFGKLYEKHPIWGYVFSVLLFASIHVIGYIGAVPPLHLLLAFLQYLPAGYCLARAYAVSGSLFTPVLIHATINLIAVLLM